MNTSLKFLIVLIAVAALSVAYPAKANLITNGNFETGDFTGWTVTHAPVGSLIFVGHGEGAPDSTLGALFGGSGPDSDAISQTFSTTAGAFYTLTFFYRVNDIVFACRMTGRGSGSVTATRPAALRKKAADAPESMKTRSDPRRARYLRPQVAKLYQHCPAQTLGAVISAIRSAA
jgi:hypothetical protein